MEFKNQIPDYEVSLRALQEFANTASSPPEKFPEDVQAVVEEKLPEDVVKEFQLIGRFGLQRYPWSLLRPVISARLVRVLNELPAPPEANAALAMRKQHLLDLLEQHNGAPFTLQRLTELLFEQSNQYKSALKYLNAVEKIVNVRLNERCLSQEEFTESLQHLVAEKQEAESSRASLAAAVPSAATSLPSGPEAPTTNAADKLDVMDIENGANAAEKLDVMDIENSSS